MYTTRIKGIIIIVIMTNSIDVQSSAFHCYALYEQIDQVIKGHPVPKTILQYPLAHNSVYTYVFKAHFFSTFIADKS